MRDAVCEPVLKRHSIKSEALSQGLAICDSRRTQRWDERTLVAVTDAFEKSDGDGPAGRHIAGLPEPGRRAPSARRLNVDEVP